MAIGNIFNTAPFDASCGRYNINGVYQLVGVVDFEFNPGASVEYYYQHGMMRPKGISRTKFDPSGSITIQTGDANDFEDYLFTSGGNRLPGGISELPTCLTATLDNGVQQIQFVFQDCRFIPQGLSFGQAGTNSPNSIKYDFRFLNMSYGTPGNERPMAIDRNALPL